MIKKKNEKIVNNYRVITIILIVFFGALRALAVETVPPALRIDGKFSGADDAESIKLSTTSSQFSRSFQVESIEKAVEGLRVSVTPLTAPNSNQIEVACTIGEKDCSNQISIKATESAVLKITASLPVEGEYTGLISLIYDNKRLTIPLTVTYKRSTSKLEIPALESVRDESMVSDEISFRMVVKETGGEKVTLFPFQLDPVLLIKTDKIKSQACCEKLLIKNEDGSEVKDPFIIEANQAKSFQLVIKGLSDPGEFSSNITVSGPDVSPITKSITLYKKRSWLLAAILIFIGVLCSYLIRIYLKTARPQLIRQHRLSMTLVELDDVARDAGNDLNEDELKVLQTFRRRLSKAYENIETLSDDAANSLNTEINRKLDIFSKWVTARRAVESLEPPQLREPLRAKLNPVMPFLETETLDEAQAQPIETMLNQIPTDVTAASKTYITEQINELSKEVGEKLQTVASDIYERLNNEVIPNIDKAKTATAKNELKEARSFYNEARFAYVRISAEDLITNLPSVPPHGFDQDSWNKTRANIVENLEKVKQAANPEAAYKDYRNAYIYYLREVTLKLKERADLTKTKINADPAIPDKDNFNTRISDVILLLSSTLEKINPEQFDEAAKDYVKARSGFEAIEAELNIIGGVDMSAEDAAPPSSPAFESITGEPIQLPFWRSVFQRDAEIPSDPGKLARRLFWLDFAIMVATLIVAVFLGLNLLWSGNAVWGGLSDYITAVLWGLGLHQVSGTAFEGMMGIYNQFKA